MQRTSRSCRKKRNPKLLCIIFIFGKIDSQTIENTDCDIYHIQDIKAINNNLKIYRSLNKDKDSLVLYISECDYNMIKDEIPSYIDVKIA